MWKALVSLVVFRAGLPWVVLFGKLLLLVCCWALLIALLYPIALALEGVHEPITALFLFALYMFFVVGPVFLLAAIATISLVVKVVWHSLTRREPET